jgi:hypothetical protein
MLIGGVLRTGEAEVDRLTGQMRELALRDAGRNRAGESDQG